MTPVRDDLAIIRACLVHCRNFSRNFRYCGLGEMHKECVEALEMLDRIAPQVDGRGRRSMQLTFDALTMAEVIGEACNDPS